MKKFFFYSLSTLVFHFPDLAKAIQQTEDECRAALENTALQDEVCVNHQSYSSQHSTTDSIGMAQRQIHTLYFNFPVDRFCIECATNGLPLNHGTRASFFQPQNIETFILGASSFQAISSISENLHKETVQLTQMHPASFLLTIYRQPLLNMAADLLPADQEQPLRQEEGQHTLFKSLNWHPLADTLANTAMSGGHLMKDVSCPGALNHAYIICPFGKRHVKRETALNFVRSLMDMGSQVMAW